MGVLLGGLGGCGKWVDKLACDDGDCFWTREEWARVESLTSKDRTNLGMPDPPKDRSNNYPSLEANGDLTWAAKLGWFLYYEPGLSGKATWKDMLGRDTATARACSGDPIRVSCATCHDPQHAGGDVTSNPRHISVGAGWYDVNGQQTLNVAHYWELDAPGRTIPTAPVLYWNGRADSLWEQAAQVIESPVSMNGDRLHNVWVLADFYRDEYQKAFAPTLLPMAGKSADVAAIVETAGPRTGQCKIAAGICPTDLGCRVPDDSPTACWPRFPLHGKTGTKTGCQAGDAAEPFGDAWDCMAKDDQQLVLRAFVNLAKAIAAYEWLLSSDDSDFDRFVRAGAGSDVLSPAAQRGLKLFVGRASCIDCHRTELFSDRKFHNIGIPQAGDGVPTVAACGTPKCDCVESGSDADGGADGGGSDATALSYSCYPWGWYTGVTRLKFKVDNDNLSRASPNLIDYRRDGKYSDILGSIDIPDSDKAKEAARYEHTDRDENDDDYTQSPDKKGKWRTPSLRDVALTAPYMHDGVFASLADVIWHYDQGVPASGIGKAAPELKPLHLSERDRGDLVAFLQSLTGRPDSRSDPRRNVAHRPDGGTAPDASPSPSGPPAAGACPGPSTSIPDAGSP